MGLELVSQNLFSRNNTLLAERKIAPALSSKSYIQKKKHSNGQIFVVTDVLLHVWLMLVCSRL